MAHRFDSEEAARARRQKGARHAHATMRAQGRVPAADATAGRMRRYQLRQLLDCAPAYECDALTGVHDDQLRRIARQENTNLDGSFDPGSSIVLDGLDD